MNKVLVVAVHPDDETLGCGATLLKHKANKDEVHWLICTTLSEDNDLFKIREKEIDKVSKLYNFDSVNNLRLKTMQVDEYTLSELVLKLSKVIKIVKFKCLLKILKNFKVILNSQVRLIKKKYKHT